MASKQERLIDRLLSLNPGLTITEGKRHWKVALRGEFIQILPYRPNREGLANNTKSEFRRRGIQF